MRKRSRDMCLRLRRCRRPFSIHPVPIQCLNRPTGPSPRRHQAPFAEMWLRRQQMKAYRKRPLALTGGHRSQRRARSATGAAPQSFVKRRRLIPIITRRSDMAMVAPGSGGGMDIGSEHRPVRDRKAVCPLKILGDVQPRPGSTRLQTIAPYRASPLTCRPVGSNCMISQARLRSPFRFAS